MSPETLIEVGIKKIMYKNLLKTSVLITSMVIVFSSCSKDDNPSTGNATNGKTTAEFNSV
jgi:hypothetical protein